MIFKTTLTLGVIFKIVLASALSLVLIYGQPIDDAKITEVLERFKGNWKEDTTKRGGLEEFLNAAQDSSLYF